MKIFLKVTQLTVASILVFYAIHYFAKPQPKTMSKEWQEASNEYALVCLLSLDASESLRFLRTMPVELDRDMLTYFLPQQSEKINPIHGISKEGYEGKGFVQSPPLEKS